MVVNGPIARELDINAGDNLFGPGWRTERSPSGAPCAWSCATCAARCPGLLDRGTLGHPGKLSFVIAENEAESPWTPLHVERGFRPEQSTVTVVAADGPRQFYNQLSNTAEGVLTTLADDMRISGSVMGQPHYVVVLGRRAHAHDRQAAAGTKTEIREFLFEHTQNSHAHLKRTQRMSGDDPARRRARRCAPLVESPDDIFVVAAGGRAGAFSCLHPGLGQCASSSSPGRDQGGQAMIEFLDPTTEAVDSDHRVRAAA